MFDAINTAGTGLTTYHTWLDAIANNIANVNDTAASDSQVFQQTYVQAREITEPGPDGAGSGVEVAEITKQAGNGDLVYDPNNPIADGDGMVRRSTVDLGVQMGDMIAAQRAFQANAGVVDRAKQVYEAAIAIGKGI